jgi:hypothetical protein
LPRAAVSSFVTCACLAAALASEQLTRVIDVGVSRQKPHTPNSEVRALVATSLSAVFDVAFCSLVPTFSFSHVFCCLSPMSVARTMYARDSASCQTTQSVETITVRRLAPSANNGCSLTQISATCFGLCTGAIGVQERSRSGQRHTDFPQAQARGLLPRAAVSFKTNCFSLPPPEFLLTIVSGPLPLCCAI